MKSYTDPKFAENSTNQLTTEEQSEANQKAGVSLGSLIISRFFNTMLGKLTDWARSVSQEFASIMAMAAITPSSSSTTDLRDAIIKLIDSRSTGLHVGDIVANIGNVAIAGRAVPDGSILTDCKTNYPDFYNYVLANTPYVTYAVWQTQVDTYGQCGFCGVNGNDIKLPLVTRPISGVTTLSQAGQAILDTMRPITGACGTFGGESRGDLPDTGALWHETGVNKNRGSDNTGSGIKSVNIDSSRLGARYSGSETRGKQVQYPFHIVLRLSGTGGGSSSSSVWSVNGRVGIVTLDKSDVGLNNVDNTSDLNKPISTATQVALDLKAGLNQVFPLITDLGYLDGTTTTIASESCYKGIADGSFTFNLPTPTDGRTHSFRAFIKAESNANINFDKKIMYDADISDYLDLTSGKYYDYIFTWQPIVSKWQMFRKVYNTEPVTLKLLLRFDNNLQDSSATALSDVWTPYYTPPGYAFDTTNHKFDYTASIQKRGEGISSALSEAEKLKAILTAIGTGDFTIGIWAYCPENGVSPAYGSGLFRFVKSNGYENINDFGMPFGWDGVCALGIGSNYDQQHVWWNAGAEVWTQGWHYLEVNRKEGVAYITFDGSVKTSGAYTVDVSAGKDNLAYMQLFGWNASGSTAVSFQEFFILSKALHIADFTPPTTRMVVDDE